MQSDTNDGLFRRAAQEFAELLVWDSYDKARLIEQQRIDEANEIRVKKLGFVERLDREFMVGFDWYHHVRDEVELSTSSSIFTNL